MLLKVQYGSSIHKAKNSTAPMCSIIIQYNCFFILKKNDLLLIEIKFIELNRFNI